MYRRNSTMPSSHDTPTSEMSSGGLRDRGDSRRNVSSTASFSNVSWSCGTSTPRCRQCQSYDPNCRCRQEQSSHIDKHTREQNVKAVLANTLFERTKAQRNRQAALAALIAEEERVRGRIVTLTKGAYAVIHDAMTSSGDQADLATYALDSMEELARLEHNARRQLVRHHRFQVPFLTLSTDEYVGRCGFVATEDKRFRELLRLHLWRSEIIDVYCQEETNRWALLQSESGQRGVLWTMYEKSFVCLESAHDALRSVLQLCSMERDDLSQEQESIRCRIAENFALGCRRIDSMMAERHKLFFEAERVFRSIAREHASRLSLTEEELAVCLDACAQRKQQNDHDNMMLVKMELKSRDALEHCELEDRSIIAAEMCGAMDSVHALLAHKSEERRVLIEDALVALESISTDFFDSRAEMVAWEASERTARHEWLTRSHDAQHHMMESSFVQMHFLYDDFERELSVMWEAMQAQEEDVMYWVAEKAACREAFVSKALHDHSVDLFAEQNEIRCQLYDQMVEEEAQIYDWIDERDEERNAAAAAEMDHRRDLERFEDSKRGEMKSRMDTVFEELEHREKMFLRGVESLHHAMGEAVQTIWYDEGAAWELLAQLEEQSYLSSIDREFFREFVSLEHQESSGRRAVSLEWARITEMTSLHFAHEQREWLRRAEEELAEACYLAESSEHEHRLWLLDSQESQWRIVLLDAEKDREISLDNEASRLREERFKQQAYYLEDERLYDESEEPLEESRMSVLEFRRSVHADLMLDVATGRKSCSGVPVAQWNELDHTREFLSQALRGYNTTRLPADVLSLFVGIVDAINDARSVDETQCKMFNKETERIQREHVRVVKAIAAEKEKCREYEERIARADVEDEAKRQRHKHLMAQKHEGLRRDEKKLQDAIREVKNIDELIERAKDAKRLTSTAAPSFPRGYQSRTNPNPGSHGNAAQRNASSVAHRFH